MTGKVKVYKVKDIKTIPKDTVIANIDRFGEGAYRLKSEEEIVVYNGSDVFSLPSEEVRYPHVILLEGEGSYVIKGTGNNIAFSPLEENQKVIKTISTNLVRTSDYANLLGEKQLSVSFNLGEEVEGVLYFDDFLIRFLDLKEGKESSDKRKIEDRLEVTIIQPKRIELDQRQKRNPVLGCGIPVL